MPAAIPEEGAGELEESQVVLRPFVIADQEGAAFREPSQRPFDDPTPRGMALFALLVQLLLANAPNVRGVAVCRNGGLPGRIVVALVQTQMLRMPRGRLGPLDHDRLQGCREQLGIVDVGSRHHHGERASLPLNQEAAFYPRLAPIGGVASDPVSSRARFPHAGIGRLPFPVYSAQLVLRRLEQRPDLIEDPPTAPALKGPMDRAVVRELLGQVIPLDPTAQSINDRVEGAPGINAFAPPGTGRVVLVQQRLDLLP